MKIKEAKRACCCVLHIDDKNNPMPTTEIIKKNIPMYRPTNDPENGIWKIKIPEIKIIEASMIPRKIAGTVLPIKICKGVRGDTKS